MKSRHICSSWGVVLTFFSMAGGCGLIPKTELPRTGDEPSLVLIYLDDSKSTDNNRKTYGEWCLSALSKLKGGAVDKIGVRMCTFRSDLIPKANLRMTGPSKLQLVALDYEDARKQPDTFDSKPKADDRPDGTSLQAVLDDVKTQTAYNPQRTLVIIFSDGGFEDGKGGSWPKALDKARALTKIPNLYVLVVGLTEDHTGQLIRRNSDFWLKSGLKAQLGTLQDGDVVIDKACTLFAGATKK